MANFAPESTSRYKVRYQTAGWPHDMVFRYTDPLGPPDITTIAGIKAFLDALNSTRFTDWTILGESYAKQGETFFLPLAPTLLPVAGTVALASAPAQGPMFYSFVGLTSAGNHARLMVFGIGNLPIVVGGSAASNWRVTRAEDADVALALDALAATPEICGIDGNPITWHQYANMKEHSHFVYKSR